MNRGNGVNCFGTYNESTDCKNCAMRQQCQAITVSDGLDVMADLVELLEAQLDETAQLPEPQTMLAAVAYLFNPETWKAKAADAPDPNRNSPFGQTTDPVPNRP